MKKQQKKLALNRETLRWLGAPRLERVRAGATFRDLNGFSGVETCGLCDSHLSCSEEQEDCCVTTV